MNFILRICFGNPQNKKNIGFEVHNKNKIEKNEIISYEDDVLLLKHYGSDKSLSIRKLDKKKYFVLASIFEEDKPAIMNKLNIPLSTKKTESDLMLDLYFKYGKDGFRLLACGFIFILIDYTKKEVLAFRDHIGIKNICYYHDKNGALYLSSSFKNIYTLNGLDFSLNTNKIKNFLDFKDFSITNTFINEINKVPPSHYLKYHKDNVHFLRYFEYDLKHKLGSQKEQISGLAELLKKSILIDKTNNYSSMGFLMSGGIDSSTIISFFKRFKETDHTIFSFSAQYKDINNEVLNLIDESEFQNEINKLDDINDVPFNGEKESTLSMLDFYLDIIGQPFFFPNLYLPNKAFSLAHDKGVAVIMNGNDGDTVISHGYEYLQHLFFSFRWMSLFKEINSTAMRRNQRRRFIFKRIIYNNLSFKNFMNSSPKKKHLKIMSSSNHSKAIEVQSMLASYYGIEERYPFYNKDLIEYCINISPDLKNKDGHSRYILKEAIKNIVPEKIRQRTKKSNLSHALCISFAEKDQRFINAQLSNPNEVIDKIININELRKSWMDFKKNPRKYATRSTLTSRIFSYVVLNRWLERHKNLKKT